MDSADSFSSGQGHLTHGPQANALVERTLEFVRDELPQWRDRKDRKRETGEEKLNAQLCKHLNAKARQLPLPVLFHHEEKQTENRRVDISAGPSEGGLVGMIYHSIDDPFVVLEGKRLPTPGGIAREREYVSGGTQRTGGIQRFKLGLHGMGMAKVALIGYLQEYEAAFWFQRINSWIRKLTESQPVENEVWTLEEQLRDFSPCRNQATARCVSNHSRTSDVDASRFQIVHLWVEMTKAPQ